ncbi:MAG: SUMF1/EgtB/PvdO family nonheme iron enzyme [Desulfobacterales bacterium]|nr:SUMF1/EgtB/PvdO family nonheme iron enzyme [Desulfobacterales bacterium]
MLPKSRVEKIEKETSEREPEKFTNSMGMEFVLIHPGTFMIGSPEDEPGRSVVETRHQVTLTRGFYMQTTEVTQGQWKAVMGYNRSHFRSGDNYPAEKVSWNDIQKFIRRLYQKEGGATYRLPTEAEWEYACRAGSSKRYCFGDNEDQLSDYAWYSSNSGEKTHPVGLKKPNAWGLYDMHGNVSEWCQDWYEDWSRKYRHSSSVTDPEGPDDGEGRIIRGGSCMGDVRSCRSASRAGDAPGERFYVFGFRLSRGIKEKPEPGRAPEDVYRLRSEPLELSDEDAKAAVNKFRNIKNAFTDNRDGTVTDRATGLMWQKAGSYVYMNYDKIQAYIDDSRKFAGHNNWRLPTLEELASLLESKRVDYSYIDPVFDRKQGRCWTADKKAPGRAWVIEFSVNRGFATSSSIKNIKRRHYVRAVRSLTVD